MYPGNCWAFKGSHGYLVIRLSLKVLPTSFCLEHIPKSLSPSGNITSAPRRFAVYVRLQNHTLDLHCDGEYSETYFHLMVHVGWWLRCSKCRHLCLQGLDDEYQEEGKLLGDYTYQEDGDSLQIFPVMVKYSTYMMK